MDLFATYMDNILPAYVSPCQDKQATEVDILTIKWGSWKHLYMVPPTSTFSKASAKMTVLLYNSNPGHTRLKRNTVVQIRNLEQEEITDLEHGASPVYKRTVGVTRPANAYLCVTLLRDHFST